MTARNNDIRKRGRPVTGEGKGVLVRFQPDQLAAVDAWASEQGDEPSRPEAVRRLVKRGLDS